MRLDPEELLGRTVGPYVLERLLGQGGFAWVFAGRKQESNEPVAVKVLKPRYAGDPQFESRFRNEFEVASELRHPHIVRIDAVGADKGITFFGMPLYPESLASIVERAGPLPEARVVPIAIAIAEALTYAHDAGIVHRDIKVDNILLAADGQAVLADFGIARAVSGYSSATGMNMTIGTPHYVSPEQAQGRTLDGRSDLYALGVTLYKAVTGDVPFRSTDWFELARMHVEDAPPPPSNKAGISRRFERVILRCLAKHPDDRYPSAAALLEDLRLLQAGSKSTEEFTMPPKITLTPDVNPRRQRILWMLAAVVVVAVVALLVVVLAER